MDIVERLAELNAAGVSLCADPLVWAAMDITTGEQLDHYLATEAYINLYKDAHGIKPRWVDFSVLSTLEIEAMITDLTGGAK